MFVIVEEEVFSGLRMIGGLEVVRGFTVVVPMVVDVRTTKPRA